MTLFTLKNSYVIENCIQHIKSLDPNKTWDVTIKRHTQKRSNPQNSMYWKWIGIIGDDLGYSPEEMHEEFASRFIGTVEKKTMSGKTLIEPVSTTTLTTNEFTEYLTMIDAFAMSQNIRLPRPEHYGHEQR